MMIKTHRVLLVMLALVGAPLSAQLPQASAAALGMGYNTTASARGFAAVANNPAGLGMIDSPGLSLAIPALAVESGLGPVTLADLADWEGRVLPAEVKDGWMGSVVESGGQGGSLALGVTPLALSIGPVGVQLSSRVGGEAILDADAVELLLYGNAGRTGTARDFDLEDSAIDAHLLSTAALSWGFRATDRLHLGATATYTVGSGLIVGRDAGTAIRSDPLSATVQFPVLFPSDSAGFDNGSGVGLDLGAMWVGPSMTIGATIQNLVNTFAWDVERHSYVAGQALFEQGNAESDFEELPASEAPRSLLDAVDDLTLEPVFAVGIEMSPDPLWRLQADVRKRVSGGLGSGPDFHAGVGAELRALSVLPLRGHFAVVSGGVQVGGGASLVLGPVHLSGALALRTGDISNATLGMITLSFGGS